MRGLMGKRLRLALLLCAIFASMAISWGLYTEPHVRAYLCPPCAGFKEIAPNIYADRHANTDQIAAVLDDLAIAKTLVSGFYGDLTAQPKWLFCLSGQCGSRSTPRALALTYANLFVFVYPEGASATILAHELAHTELHHRVGSLYRWFSQAVPAWFDEGLAVIISRDPRYLNMEGGEIWGCKSGDWAQPPSDARKWRRVAATQSQSIYTASACRVIDWMNLKGGPKAVLAMLGQIADGAYFVE
jgi:hypothetical protein